MRDYDLYMREDKSAKPGSDDDYKGIEETGKSLLGSSWTSDSRVATISTSSTDELVDSDDD